MTTDPTSTLPLVRFFAGLGLLLATVVGGCSNEPIRSDWQHLDGSSFTVQADTLVSTRDTSVILGEVRGFSLGDRAFYLVDNMAMKIHVFDLDGNHLRSVGGRGRGPGEFLNMSAVAWLPSRRELAVYDHMNFRLSRLDGDGEFVGSCDYSPTEIEWPRSLTEVDEDHHVAVYLISSGLTTGIGRELLHKVNTVDCSVTQSALALEKLDHFEKEQTFLGVFSLFSPGNLAKAADGTFVFKTGIDDSHIYKVRAEDLSTEETIAFSQPDQPDPYFLATMGMEQDPRVMAVSGQIGVAAVLQSDLIGFGPYDDGTFYQFIMYRPSADSIALYFDVLDTDQKKRTRHVLNNTLPINNTTRRGISPVFRILGYDLKTRMFFASSFIEGEHYLLRIKLTETP